MAMLEKVGAIWLVYSLFSLFYLGEIGKHDLLDGLR